MDPWKRRASLLLRLLVIANIHHVYAEFIPDKVLDPNEDSEFFSCHGRILGDFYADVHQGCRVFHACVRNDAGATVDVPLGCAPGTLFDQTSRQCQPEKNVRCAEEEDVNTNQSHQEMVDTNSMVQRRRRQSNDEEDDLEEDRETTPPIEMTSTQLPKMMNMMDMIPKTHFTCRDKQMGSYYADLETDCKLFHICAFGVGAEVLDFRFLCLNETRFNSETKSCEATFNCPSQKMMEFMTTMNPDNVEETTMMSKSKLTTAKATTTSTPSPELIEEEDIEEELEEDEEPTTSPPPRKRTRVEDEVNLRGRGRSSTRSSARTGSKRKATRKDLDDDEDLEGTEQSPIIVEPAFQVLSEGVRSKRQVVMMPAAGVPGAPCFDYSTLPFTTFTCAGKVPGSYYADPEAMCQMYHVCAPSISIESLIDFRFLCPNETIFDQATLKCMTFDAVDCLNAPLLYALAQPPVVPEVIPSEVNVDAAFSSVLAGQGNVADGVPPVVVPASDATGAAIELAEESLGSVPDAVMPIVPDGPIVRETPEDLVIPDPAVVVEVVVGDAAASSTEKATVAAKTEAPVTSKPKITTTSKPVLDVSSVVPGVNALMPSEELPALPLVDPVVVPLPVAPPIDDLIVAAAEGVVPLDSDNVPLATGAVPSDGGLILPDSGMEPIDSGLAPLDSGLIPADRGLGLINSGIGLPDSSLLPESIPIAENSPLGIKNDFLPLPASGYIIPPLPNVPILEIDPISSSQTNAVNGAAAGEAAMTGALLSAELAPVNVAEAQANVPEIPLPGVVLPPLSSSPDVQSAIVTSIANDPTNVSPIAQVGDPYFVPGLMASNTGMDFHSGQFGTAFLPFPYFDAPVLPPYTPLPKKNIRPSSQSLVSPLFHPFMDSLIMAPPSLGSWNDDAMYLDSPLGFGFPQPPMPFDNAPKKPSKKKPVIKKPATPKPLLPFSAGHGYYSPLVEVDPFIPQMFFQPGMVGGGSMLSELPSQIQTFRPNVVPVVKDIFIQPAVPVVPAAPIVTDSVTQVPVVTEGILQPVPAGSEFIELWIQQSPIYVQGWRVRDKRAVDEDFEEVDDPHEIEEHDFQRDSQSAPLSHHSLPTTSFSCIGKVTGGYYADVETDCQMFHVCALGGQGEVYDFKFMCTNDTAFNQPSQTCAIQEKVDCTKAPLYYPRHPESIENIPVPNAEIRRVKVPAQSQHRNRRALVVDSEDETFPDTSFNCKGKKAGGYYADPETDCHVFHVCARGEAGMLVDFRFKCANETVFNQRSNTCDEEKEVDCENSVLLHNSDDEFLSIARVPDTDDENDDE